MKTSRNLRLLAGVVCLVLAFWPGWEYQNSQSPSGATTARKALFLGIPPSPWLVVQRSWTETPGDRPGQTFPSFVQNAEVRVVSVSFGLLVAGVVLLTWRRRTKARADVAAPSVLTE